ncbi:GDSL-type esterase/lipase family protein [Clostridium faecium]|uniref:Peptidase n=1 Tax=Clostridium faecium TaxID=2762223 RepID=A0ABR8YST5_9CLOT|nr:GDSL-type esterase/lipase family protein [Clostridium faecium]MBD8047323.1 peptidase [Clostridium faecium]MDU1350297.1 GDSL-type esterase/lipase family protein [Clostridium argentinense]
MNSIVCIGDSLTYGYGVSTKSSWVELLRKKLNNVNVINAGVNGDTTIGMVNRFTEDVVYNNPDIVVILGGTNDFLTNKSAENALKNIKIMVKETIENNIIPIILAPQKTIEDLALKCWDSYCDYSKVNSLIEQFGEVLNTFCHNEGIDFINLNYIFEKIENNRYLYTDGIHLSEEGNKLLFEAVFNIIKKKVIIHYSSS